MWIDKAKGELRWWWHFGKRSCFHLQLAKPHFHMGFGIGDWENTLSGDFCGIYWHFENPWLATVLKPFHEQDFRFYWHELGLWLQIWGGDNYDRSDPWWRKMHHLNFPDLLLGRSKYSKREIEQFDNILIPMPEGTFKATMTFEECTWKRPRWFPRVRLFTDIKVEQAPKFPGKGENSWDQGDDSIHGMAVDGHSLPKAIGGYVEAVMEYRLRRAGVRALKTRDLDRRLTCQMLDRLALHVGADTTLRVAYEKLKGAT